MADEIRNQLQKKGIGAAYIQNSGLRIYSAEIAKSLQQEEGGLEELQNFLDDVMQQTNGLPTIQCGQQQAEKRVQDLLKTSPEFIQIKDVKEQKIYDKKSSVFSSTLQGNEFKAHRNYNIQAFSSLAVNGPQQQQKLVIRKKILQNRVKNSSCENSDIEEEDRLSKMTLFQKQQFVKTKQAKVQVDNKMNIEGVKIENKNQPILDLDFEQHGEDSVYALIYDYIVIIIGIDKFDHVYRERMMNFLGKTCDEYKNVLSPPNNNPSVGQIFNTDIKKRDMKNDYDSVKKYPKGYSWNKGKQQEMVLEDVLSINQMGTFDKDEEQRVEVQCFIEGSDEYRKFTDDMNQLKIFITKDYSLLDHILEGEYNGKLESDQLVILVKNDLLTLSKQRLNPIQQRSKMRLEIAKTGVKLNKKKSDDSKLTQETGFSTVASSTSTSTLKYQPSLPQSGLSTPKKNTFKSNQEVPNCIPVAIPPSPNEEFENYKPTKIKIINQENYELKNHPINVAIRNYNTFIHLTFKNKDPTSLNYSHIIKLSKIMGLGVNKNQIQDLIVKNREVQNPVKEKLNTYLHSVINKQNDVNIIGQKNGMYKMFTGKGNNSLLIRRLFKERWWWTMNDKAEMEEVNFMWTQWKKQPFFDVLPTKADLDNRFLTMSIDLSNPLKKRKSRKSRSVIPQTQQLNEETQKSINDWNPHRIQIYGKIEHNYHLSNKKALFINMLNYYSAMSKDPFDALPVTFHIKTGTNDPQYQKFKEYFLDLQRIKSQEESPDKKKTQNIWIVKPGENTNQGNGIQVARTFEEIKDIIIDSTKSGKRTCIVQKYIHNPMLINKRKFDIRTFCMISSINGQVKAYVYEDMYFRTSSKEFNLFNLQNRFIHLTNDAVQKKSEDYGKFETCNKLSVNDFQKYLDSNHGDMNICWTRDLLPQIKVSLYNQKLITDSVRAVFGRIDPQQRLNTFECFGYDFMIDEEFKIYLIEVNTNPCLDQP